MNYFNLKTDKINKQTLNIKSKIIFDLTLFILLFIIAIFSKSLILLSSAFIYLITLVSLLLPFLILRKNQKDKSVIFQFSKDKLKNIVTFIILFIIIFFIIYLIYESIFRIIEKPVFDYNFLFGGVILHIIGISIGLIYYLKIFNINKIEKSSLFKTHFKVNLINAILSLCIICVLLFIYFISDKNLVVDIDRICGIFLLIISGIFFIELVRRSIQELSEKNIEEKFKSKILYVLSEYEDKYIRLYEIKTKKTANKIFIEISLGFEPQMILGDALETCSRIKEDIENIIENASLRIVINAPDIFEETLQRPINLFYKPLSEEYLEDCLKIAKFKFPNDEMDRIKLEFLGSINPAMYKKELEKLGISSPRYWVTLFENKVVGFTGLNYHLNDPEAIWGGWMARSDDCPKSSYELGMAQFWKPFFEARLSGRKYLRFITSTLPSEKGANVFYRRRGYTIYKREKMNDYEILFWQGDLTQLYEKFKSFSQNVGK